MPQLLPPRPEPEPDGQSCIVRKFASMVSLSQYEKELLNDLEQQPQNLPAGHMAKSFERNLPPLLVVKSGWLISEHTSEAGNRTIVRSHHPGDIIGFSELAFRSSAYQSFAKSNAVVCPFTRNSMKELLARSPRLSSIFLAVSLIEQSQQDDRACVTGRNHASGKIALFILQTIQRLQMVSAHSDDRFHCPLTQADIGDLVGLTNVHVSRTFKKLEDAEFVRRNRSFIQVLDAPELRALAGYSDRFRDYDFSWLPAAALDR